jgi:uncharacterized membrane protein
VIEFERHLSHGKAIFPRHDFGGKPVDGYPCHATQDLTMRSAVFLLLSILFCSPAQAGFSVCNKAARPAKVALGRFNGTQWMSEGWWSIDARKCTKLLTGPLDARYYYVFATDGHSGTWDGARYFCTGAAKFSIVGRANCAARGFDRRGFFEVDTGKKPDFTQSLSD